MQSNPSDVVASRTIVGTITRGKWYDIQAENECQYTIMADNGEKIAVHKSHFKDFQVNGYTVITPSKKIRSDGGATDYYDLPAGATTLYDLIEHRDMNFSEGNVFKAVYRMGTKEGVDHLYDWRKIKFCAEREIARLEKLTVSEKKDG